MKVKNLLLVALVTIGFTSCSNDDDLSEVNNEGNAWTSFSIALPSAKTTRADKGETEEGTTDEQAVKDVRVVLYNNNLVAYAFDLEVKTDEEANFNGNDVLENATKSVFETKAQKVKKQDYQVLVILNPQGGIKEATNPGKFLEELEKAVDVDVEEFTGVGFLMTNTQGLVTLSQDQLKESEEAAEKATDKVKVPVDRAVAKVFVSGTPKTVEGSGDKVELQGWALDVTNKKAFYMRKMTKTFEGKAEVIGDDRWARYAEDPNFGEVIGAENFNYLSGIPSVDQLNEIGTADEDAAYVLENTMEANWQNEDLTTRVILKANYIPKGFKANDSWLSYKGFILSVADFNEKLALALALEEGKDLAGVPAGFTADMKELSKDEAAIKDEKLVAEKSFIKNNLKYYHEGVNYYPVYIRHFEDATTDMQYGRYGVVRNNVYKLTINSITKPGEPEVVKPEEPEIPVDKKESYVSFNVTVQPWLVRNQSVDI